MREAEKGKDKTISKRPINEVSGWKPPKKLTMMQPKSINASAGQMRNSLPIEK